MKNIMEGSTKGKGALGGVDQGIMEDIEKDEHENLNIQAFTPMPSNDEEGKDVPLPETFVDTPKEDTNISPFTPKSVSCKLLRVFWQNSISQMIIDYKCQLFGKNHEQICERFY
jgi:hypothetical protein